MPADANIARVLIVDDDPYFLEQVSWAVEPLGSHRIARSGGAALRVAVTWEPDVILLDMLLDDLDGFTILERLADAGLQRNPFILFTTDGRGADTRIRPLPDWQVGTLVRSSSIYQLRTAIRQAVHCQGPLRRRSVTA